MKPSSWRPRPGTVFGLLALVIAVAGTAIAGTQATKSAFSKKEKNQVKSIATKKIKALGPRLYVKRAKNADKVDQANVCSGTVTLQGAGAHQQTLCSAGPLSIVATCDIGPTSVQGRVNVQGPGDGSGWLFGESLNAPGTAIAEVPLSSAPYTVAVAVDSSASPVVYDGSGAWVSAGATAGSSLGGEFSIRTNLTGSSAGDCRVTSSAIAR